MFRCCTAQKKVKPSKLEKKQILLLGAGETGKTTITKSLCYAYGDTYETEEKKLQFKSYIHENIINGLKKMIDNLGSEMTSDLNKHANIILAKGSYATITPEDADHVKKLWESEAIQVQWTLHRHALQLPDGLGHLLRRIHVICRDSYIPTHDDIVHVRRRTTGILEATIKTDGRMVTIIDVGGQQNERRKWMNAFQDVDCVLYVAALSNFCQVMWENNTKNRLDDSLELFSKVIHQEAFVDKDIWLFLNKKDIFGELMRRIDLSEHFDDYAGQPFSFNDGCSYFEEKFLILNKNNSRKIFVHHTEATNIDSIQHAFQHIMDKLNEAE